MLITEYASYAQVSNWWLACVLDNTANSSAGKFAPTTE